MSVNKTHNI